MSWAKTPVGRQDVYYSRSRDCYLRGARTTDVVYITRGLSTALRKLAADRDPDSVTIALDVLPAAELEFDPGAEVQLPPGASVFTDMYLPETGDSVTAVFGMDISTPGAAGRFVSHPDGALSLRKSDDFHEVVFVAVPPYEPSCVAAFDRSGTELQIETVPAEPPVEGLEEEPR